MKRSIALVVLFIVLIFLAMGALQMRTFGEPDQTEMDEHFLYDEDDGSQARNQVNNVVTAVLFDYRGLDTLGEATILFSAVSGVLTVLREVKKKKEAK
ncbi:MAG: hydrogen gas-evolving membrane-bound hydrogenase subunit E [Candidatus Thermoplasmatota archaeon]